MRSGLGLRPNAPLPRAPSGRGLQHEDDSACGRLRALSDRLRIYARLEEKFIHPYLDIARWEKIPTVDDYRDVPGLEVRPPDIMRYFVRVKKEVLRDFVAKNHLGKLHPGRAEDEFMCQNAFKLNTTFYSALGDKKAFVMSHGRNMLILKIVGYAELVASYYRLEDYKANIWIAHQRYPTKGRVWHPGGAHPFIGLNEALVHNGDFANYHSVVEYLRQRNLHPLFLTDTEAHAHILLLCCMLYILCSMRMTFSLPDALAHRFLASVPNRERSATIAKLREAELAKRHHAWKRPVLPPMRMRR